MTVRIITGDCREVLKTLEADSVHCCVTSPPYFGLRDYGNQAQIGLELTPDEFVAALVAVFREVRRVLRDDGTVWLNLGDSYASGGRATYRSGASDNKGQLVQNDMPRPKDAPGIKPKDLIGIPWRVAFALQADGWYLRQDIIWAKPNPMPESVADRCTKAHEYLFLLSKSERYSFDAAAIAEPAVYSGLTGQDESGFKDPESYNGKHAAANGNFRKSNSTNESFVPDGSPHTGLHRAGTPRGGRAAGNKTHKYVEAYEGSETEEHRTKAGLMKVADVAYGTRNKRSVWTVATQPFKGAHFATFPPALIEPCILAGCPSGGVVLDPFGGAGTTGLVADRLGRDAVLIELNPEYVALAEHRMSQDGGMFYNLAAQ